jgi:Nif-specific regulatory protein
MDFTRDQLTELLNVSKIINSSLDLDNVLDQIITLTSKILNTEASSLLLIDEPTNKLIFKTAAGAKAEEVSQFTLKIGEGIAGWVAENGEPLLVNDVTKEKRFRRSISESIDFPTKSILCVPLILKNKIIGVVEVINKTNGLFNDSDIQLLSGVAEQAVLAIENARRHFVLGQENRSLKEALAERPEFIGTKSKSTQDLIKLADRVSQTDSTLLLSGETGSGKELVAQMIHNKSKRKANPFTCVTCAILTETILESELFGHEKGSFTGAVTKKIGKFELAHKGTVFLDEISSIPLSTQTKLLRVLQEREFERVGGAEVIKVDIRVIAATNENLQELINEGKFREDLYYRLKVIEIPVPPLRERKEDIPEIAQYFLAKYSKEMDRKVDKIDSSAMQLLTEYAWPGNIRELKNVIERAVVLGVGDTLLPDHLPLEIQNKSTQIKINTNKGMTLFEMEKWYTEEVLKSTGGNKSQAAKQLGISRNRLDRKLKGEE